MSLSRVGVIIGLELRQRLRSVVWYVLLAVFAAVLLVVTVITLISVRSFNDEDPGAGGAAYAIIVFLVMLLAMLVGPAVSGNAINGDREQATLATVQVTQVTTSEIVVGKFIAAWITSLAFLAVAVPFVLVAMISGGVRADIAIVSLLVLLAETAVFAAIGVGLSGLIARPLFSVVITYLVLAALAVGSLIGFGLGGMAIRSETVSHSRYLIDEDTCSEWETTTSDVPRFDRVWGVLAVNPFVILADATPTRYSAAGYPSDAFGSIKWGVRMAQIPPELEWTWDDCAATPPVFEDTTAQEQIEGTVPSWFVGLAFHVLLGAGLLVWAGFRTHTPARRLPPGTRIA